MILSKVIDGVLSEMAFNVVFAIAEPYIRDVILDENFDLLFEVM
jgi:hypothetical protein